MTESELARRIADCLEDHLANYGFDPHRYPSGENKSVEVFEPGVLLLSDADGRAWTVTVTTTVPAAARDTNRPEGHA